MTPRELTLLLGGHAFFQTLASACDVGLFTYLARRPGSSSREIARGLRLPAHSTRILLDTCIALGLVERGPRHRNTADAAALFTPESPANILPIVDALHHLHYRPMFHLRDALRTGTNAGLCVFPGTGKTLYERLARSPELEAVFHSWLQRVSQLSNPKLAGVRELGRARRLLDIGGGNGTNAIRLVETYPDLHVTILDLPSVCALARKTIAARGLAHRIDAIEGNFLNGPIPRGFDAILIAHLLTIYSEPKNIRLLAKCHRALPAGGMLVNLDDHGDAGPHLASAPLSLYFLAIATGEGMVYPFADVARWFAEAGFGRVQRYRGIPGVIVARKRRAA